MKKRFNKFLTLLAVLLLGFGQMWAAASTTTDGKYATGTIDFSTIGTLSATTTYWHNGVKFYSGNSANVSANNTAWSTSVSIPAYVSNVTAGKDANKCKWGNGGTAKQYTQSGFACSQHTIGIHVNQACTLTVVVNKNLGSDTDNAGITASIDGVAYGTAYSSSTYKEAGSTALTVTSARADKTNASGRYTLTIVVTAGDLTDGEAVVKMFNGSSGTGSGKLFCWESITVTPAAVTKHTVTYKAGDGTGTDVVDNDAKTVKAFADCSFTAPSGYEFKEWQDGSSNVVAEGATVSTDMTLTAIYRLIPTKYTVTYDLNGAPGDAPTETNKAEGDEFTLASAPSWAGHAFDGWLCSADAAVKAAGSSYTMTAANTTFTAQWHEVDCKIYSLTGAIGSAEVTAGTATVSADALVLGNSAARIKLTPATGETFKSGDVITISGAPGNIAKKFSAYVYAANGSTKLATLTVANAGDLPLLSGTLSGDADYVFLARIDGTTQNIYTCEVHRSCAEGTAAGLSYATGAVAKLTTDAAFTNPLTNANSLYVAGYGSSDPTVATVDAAGQVTIVGAGSATITAYSATQTKAGTLYAAGTASYTLTVTAPPTYAVTYAANGGEGTMIDPNSPYLEGAEVTLLANAFTAPTSQEFDAWVVTETVSGDPVSVSAGKFTMPAVDVTVTATWRAVTEKYTVHYMDEDGTTPLGADELVIVGQNPVGISATKALFTFAAWQKEGVDIALDDAFWATVVKDATVTLTARWTKAYATSYDMEAYAASVGASKAGLEEELTAANYAFTNINGIDNEHTHNYTYDGMKYKTTDGDLSFNVLGGKVVEVKTGHLPTNDAVTMYINGVADATVFEGANEDVETHKTNYFYSAAEALYRLEVLASKGTCSVKKVTIRDPFTVSFEAHGDADPSALQGLPSVTLPDATNGTASLLGWFDAETGGNKIGDAGATYIPTANITLHAQWESISTDARLASITLDPSTGVWEPAFNPEIVNYTYTMPYGTVAVPQITGATAVNAGGSYSIVSQASAWDETAVIRGVAASSDTKAYNITMKIAPKDPVCLVWADIPSANTLTYNASKSLLAEDAVTLAISGVSGKDGSAPSGVKFQKGGYIKIEKNEGTFEEGDIVALDVTYVAGSAMHVFKVQTPSTAADVIGTGATATTPAGVNKVTITEDATALYLARPDNESEYKDWNPHVDYVAVYRAMDPVLKSITFDGTKINVTGTSVSATLPNGADLTDVTPEIFWNGAGTAVVTTNEGAWDWGANTYVLTDKDGDATSYTITLTEDVLKHTVSYYSYNGEDLLGTEQVEDGENPTATGITAPSRLGFTFQGWAITVGGDVEDLNDITINADDELYAVYAAIPCPTSGTVYKFEIKDGLASENLPIATDMDMSSYIDATGIGLLTYSATANNKATINSDGTIQLKDATAAYLKVELACALAAGDQIRAHVSNNPIRVQVGTTYDSSKDLILAKDNYVFVDITSAMEGKKVLYIARSTNGNANLADFEIYRRPELTGASLADLTMRQGQNKTPELTLEPSADAIVTSQVWEIVGTPVNLIGATIDGATGAITTGTLDDASSNGTITVKVTLNGSIEATCTVTVVDAIVQANVTKSTIWDWHNTGATAEIKLTNDTDPKRNEAFVLANVAVNNNADFESDKLVVEGEYMVRDYNKTNPYFQGQTIKFNTTKAGVVRVKFSNTGNNPARELYINGVGTGNSSANATLNWSDYVEVPAGEVSITAFYVDPAEGTGQQYIRVAEIEFLEKIDSRTGYAANELGTACYEYDAVVIGATAYMIAGINESGYIVFDEIGELEAGKPYLFEADGGKIFFCKPIGVTAAPLANGDEITIKGMVGTFTGTTLTQGADDLCYFSGRHLWRVNDFTVGVPIPEHRCYVNYDVLKAEGPASAPAAGRRRISMGVNGENQAQGFENILGGDQPMKVMIDGTLYIIRGEKKYDATGRLVK